MSTAAFAWSTVTNWTNLGLVHHRDVAKLVETDKVLNTYIHGADEVLPSPLDPETVIAAVEARAERMALNDGHNSPMSRAVANARHNIAAQGISTVRVNIDHYTDQLTERFADAAKRYETNSVQLPDRFVADDLAGFSPQVFNAYRETATAAAELRQVRDYLSSLKAVLGATSDKGFSPVFLIVDPGSTEVFSSVQHAAPASADRVFEAIDPVMLRAIKAGASLTMSTPDERDEMCRSYKLQIEQADAARTAKTRGSVIR